LSNKLQCHYKCQLKTIFFFINRILKFDKICEFYGFLMASRELYSQWMNVC